MAKVIDSANFSASNPIEAAYPAYNFNPAQSAVGTITYLGNNVNAIPAVLNASSEEDFFISGVFLQSLSITNGNMVVDLAKKNGVTYPKVVSVLTRPVNDQITTIYNANGIKYTRYEKGQQLDLHMLGDESVAFIMDVVLGETLVAGDLIMVSDDALKVMKHTTGRECVGRIVIGGSTGSIGKAKIMTPKII